jgi:glycosyltransferase involved in cell wall biosynthesis
VHEGGNVRVALNCAHLKRENPDGIGILGQNVLAKIEADTYCCPVQLPKPLMLAGWYVWAYTGLSAWLNIKRPDVLLNIDIALPFYKPNVHLLCDIVPLIMPGVVNKLFETAFRTLTWDAIHRADAIVTISHSSRKEIEKYYHLPENTVKVIYPGYNHEIFRRVYDTSVLDKHRITKPYALFIGTLAPKKNIVRIAKAFEQASVKNMELLIVGQTYTNEKDIKSAIEKPNIRRLGYVPLEDLPVLLSSASMLVWPSLKEGFGLPIIEAMACGCPVITSNISSMPEVAGGAAILVDPYDVDEIAEAIKTLSISPALAFKLGKQGIDRAKSFSWQNMANELIKVCESVR